MKKALLCFVVCAALLTGCGSKPQSVNEEAAVSTAEKTTEATTEAITETETSENIADIIYFDEVPDLPTPNSVVDGSAFVKKETDNGIIKYTYILNEDEDISNKMLNDYCDFIETNGSYSVDTQNNVIYVLKGTELISAMMGGYENGSYFLMVSFPE